MPKYKPRVLVEPEEDDEEELDDTVPAVLASLLLCMCCPDCGGSGLIDKGQCNCRKFGFRVAMGALQEEGLI